MLASPCFGGLWRDRMAAGASEHAALKMSSLLMSMWECNLKAHLGRCNAYYDMPQLVWCANLHLAEHARTETFHLGSLHQ